MKQLRSVLVIVLWVVANAALGVEEKTLYVYNWSEYLPEAVLEQFEQETGIKVVYSTFDSNEAMYAKLRLVDEKNRPCIIDFDKARYMKDRNQLRKRYHKRWNRAIVKHGLPGELARIMTLADADM